MNNTRIEMLAEGGLTVIAAIGGIPPAAHAPQAIPANIRADEDDYLSYEGQWFPPTLDRYLEVMGHFPIS